MNAFKLITTGMSVKQLRNGKRMAGVSTPMFVLETPTWQWEPFTTCCLRGASDWDKSTLNFPFFCLRQLIS